jgi:hypothetical protein
MAFAMTDMSLIQDTRLLPCPGEFQTEQLPINKVVVAQTKPHHRQELDNGNSVEIKQHDIEKLQQVFLIVPEGTDNSSIMEKDVTEESESLSLQNGNVCHE